MDAGMNSCSEADDHWTTYHSALLLTGSPVVIVLLNSVHGRQPTIVWNRHCPVAAKERPAAKEKNGVPYYGGGGTTTPVCLCGLCVCVDCEGG